MFAIDIDGFMYRTLSGELITPSNAVVLLGFSLPAGFLDKYTIAHSNFSVFPATHHG